MNGDDKAFSSIDFIGQCLVDEERTKQFKNVITKLVKPTNSVIDLGSGSGILAMFAAKAGAKKVIAVEFDDMVASIAKKHFLINKLNKKISVITGDARKLKFDKNTKFNLVICEMLTTGMVDEHQIESINNLHNQGVLDKTTVFIPQRNVSYVSLVNANLKFLGQNISMVLHLWKWHNWSFLNLDKMSRAALLNSVDFKIKNKTDFAKILKIKITKSGIVNSLYLTSRLVLDKGQILGDTEALNAPMLIPIKTKKVKKGQEVELLVKYIFGGGYSNFYAEIIN